MCGIAGYHGREPLPQNRIDACLALMDRRGPDHRDSRTFLGPNGFTTCLLHSRLAIIDRSQRSNQPMQVNGGWIALNGELYNYVELMGELKSAGVVVRTQSDTEVLLALIRRFGWDALDRCEGMWAFALYDQAKGSVTLCRDRFGEKPLYVLRDAAGTYFGSEIKFVVALSGRCLDINHDHLWRYLVNGYKALYKSAGSFFRGVEEIPAGTTLELTAEGKSEVRRYWEPTISIKGDMGFDEAVLGARNRLVRSMEMRLRADVPIAFCMSGGVDSTALISIARRVFGYDVHGFTIVNTDARYEEADMVETVVRELGIRHTEIPIETSGFLQGLRELVRQHDAPVYTITYYAHWLLMRSIAEHGYRIAVSGTGADELFTGYYDHFLAHFQGIQGDAKGHAQAVSAWEKHVRPVVRNPHLGNSALFVDDPMFREHIFLNADEFARYLRFEWRDGFSETRYSENLLRNRMLNELFHESVPVILHEDDLNAMFFSVENRSPFLDRQLFEFCNSIPTHHLIRDGRAKAVLREAVRGIAPDAIVDNRRKVGFNAPIMDFLDVNDREVREYLLDDGPIFEFVHRRRIEALISKATLPNSESKFLFYFLNCKMFLEEFAHGAAERTNDLVVAS